jgi:signal transduction histidine kinase
MGRDLNLSHDEKTLFLQGDNLFSAFIDLYRDSDLKTFVRGIVHNLNGSLQVVSMHMELLQSVLTKAGEKIHPSVSGKVEKCLDEVDRMKAMMEILAARGGQEKGEAPQAIHLNEMIEGELSFLRNHLFFKHQVRVKKVFVSPLPPLKGYAMDFRRGLLNLLLNAIEAMEETPQKELTVVSEADDHFVQFTVKDTGCGISREGEPFLFKPFFSTKGKGHHGLGLFMAREFLAPYGASFHFSSQEGETLFSIRFPIPAASR